jgi:hypothetical protein
MLLKRVTKTIGLKADIFLHLDVLNIVRRIRPGF